MQVETKPSPIAVDERGLVAVLPLSLDFVRADRRSRRLLPFYKVGSRVLYNLDRVREALAALEVGGPAPVVADKRRR